MPGDIPRLLTIADLAEIVPLSKAGLRRLASQRTIPCQRLGRQYLFHPGRIRDWLAQFFDIGGQIENEPTQETKRQADVGCLHEDQRQGIQQAQETSAKPNGFTTRSSCPWSSC